MPIRVKKAAKYGFCSGVRIADRKVRQFAQNGGSCAILGQVVHNERVVEEMEALGVRMVHRLEDVREPVVVFSAHGVPPSVHRKATEMGLEILDTTCRFVYDIHRESRKALSEGSHLVFIGDPGHREVIGYTYDLEPDSFHILQKIEQAQAVDWTAYPSIRIFYQTTLNALQFEDLVRWIEARNANTMRADTICYATRGHQESAREMALDDEVDLVIVVGGRHSANTRHMYEICRKVKRSRLIQGARDVDAAWLEGISCVGLTAGASTPDTVVEEVERRIIELAKEGGSPGGDSDENQAVPD